MSTRVGRAQQRAFGATAQDRDARRGCSDPRTVDQARLPEPTVIVHGLDRGERTAIIPRECELGHVPGRANGPDDPIRRRDERPAQLGEAGTFPRCERAATIGREHERVEVGSMLWRPQEPDIRRASRKRDREPRCTNRPPPPGVSTDLRPLEDMTDHRIGVAASERERDDLSGQARSMPARAAVVGRVEAAGTVDVDKAVPGVRELECGNRGLRRERRKETRAKCLPASVERTSARHQVPEQWYSPSTQRSRVPTIAAASGLNPCGTP